jgi:hypothetical protein
MPCYELRVRPRGDGVTPAVAGRDKFPPAGSDIQNLFEVQVTSDPEVAPGVVLNFANRIAEEVTSGLILPLLRPTMPFSKRST